MRKSPFPTARIPKFDIDIAALEAVAHPGQTEAQLVD
jgi:hypothetical protein